MRIAIVGQYGNGNCGDEGILLAIMDALGFEHEYIAVTTLPFNMVSSYSNKVPNLTDVRTLEDTRTDYDVCLYGGGKIDYGFAWGHFIRAFQERIPTMGYGIQLLGADLSLRSLYAEYFKRFGAITTRDIPSRVELLALSVRSTETMCPAINLKEEKTSCVEGGIAVCPRYGDFKIFGEKGEVDNSAQIDWFTQKLAGIETNEITLIPFHPKDLEGQPRDVELCREINRRLGGGCNIFPSDGFNARKVKYAISKSRMVLSGGRYHAIVWAIAHNIPYVFAPTVSGVASEKLRTLEHMYNVFGREKLMVKESKNKAIFEEMLKR